MQKIPARYIGEHSVLLHDAIEPYLDAQGKILPTRTLCSGDTLMMRPEELLGQTFLHGTSGDVEYLGVGRIVKPEHAHLKDDPNALLNVGYEFHEGRSDFAEIKVSPAATIKSKAKDA